MPERVPLGDERQAPPPPAYTAWGAGTAAALVVMAGVAWLKYSDGRASAGALADALALFQTDGAGPEVALLVWPGFLVGALFVTVMCWSAGYGQPAALRVRAALAAGGTSGLLFFTDVRLLSDYGTDLPYATADTGLRWTLVLIAPTAGLVTGMAARAAMGQGAGRGRLVMTAATATATLLLVAVYLLREVQDKWARIDIVYGITLTTGVPIAGLLTGFLVHLTARRSLRPVEAIRREMEDITSQSLDRRVPVPAGTDVIADLARTTNETLDRLEQASARQQQFVGDAAHELRSPLAGLRAQLESALRHPGSVQWPSVVENAAADVVRLQALADDLLLLARMDGTRHPCPEPKAVDLSAIAEDLVREHQHLPVARKLELSREADGPAPVMGDASQLERLLRNLIGNACRHASRTVVVRTRPDVNAGTVVVQVADDGAGIPQADRERVFERFTRLDEARARASGGAGLGLAIAREIAARHGGTLTVADRARGACLEGRFPLCPLPQEPAQDQGPVRAGHVTDVR
ncbi:HAMP domain-containing histidine kinase [Streptomyces sp. NBC_01410]|uniref:sensor histidine kinase n=1 Tax=Streptomyces sp. NBC_01410 TaxID=2903856 RepID=UPI00324B7E36